MTEQELPRFEEINSEYRLITAPHANLSGLGNTVTNAKEWSFPAEAILDTLAGRVAHDPAIRPVWQLQDCLDAYRRLDDGHPLKQQYTVDEIRDTYERIVKPLLDE